MKCANPACGEEINKALQDRTEASFYYCRECGTVVYKESVQK